MTTDTSTPCDMSLRSDCGLSEVRTVPIGGTIISRSLTHFIRASLSHTFSRNSPAPIMCCDRCLDAFLELTGRLWEPSKVSFSPIEDVDIKNRNARKRDKSPEAERSRPRSLGSRILTM